MEETTKSRRRFDKQFKLDAVRLLNEGGRMIAELSRDLGVSPNQMRRWNEKYGKASANANGVSSDSAESIENIKLKRALALCRGPLHSPCGARSIPHLLQ